VSRWIVWFTVAAMCCSLVAMLCSFVLSGEIVGIEVKPTPVGVILTITSVIGKGEIRERTTATWQPLRAKMSIIPGYQLRTDKESMVEARLEPTLSRIKVSHDTLIEVRNDRLVLLAGRIWVCAAQKPGERIPIVIQTPNAYIATERGWISVAQLPWGWTLVSCDRNTASVAASRSVVPLLAGEMTLVAPGSKPEVPMKVTCDIVSWDVRIYLEEFVKRCHGIPPRPLPKNFLSCAERLLWDAGGIVPR